MIVMIDAGHGGNDPGAVGNGLREADITGILAHKVHDYLSACECQVRFTNRGELSARAKEANDLKADLFVSLHVNAGGGTGFESFIHNMASDKTNALRRTIHDTVMWFLGEHYDIIDRGLKRANFAVLRETQMPAVLLECLFIDNPNDAELLKSDTFLDGLAGAIATGIVLVLGLKKKGENQSWSDMAEEVAQLRKENVKLRERNSVLEQRMQQINSLSADAVAYISTVRKEGRET